MTFSPDAESALASLNPGARQVAPDAAGARQLGRSYRGLLKQELIRAIEHAEAGLEAQVPLLHERIESLDPSKRFSPALFSGLSRIANAFRSESSDSVLDALQWLCSMSRKDLLDSRFRLGSILEEHWEEPFVAEIRKPPTDRHREGDTQVQPLLETDLSIVDTVYSNALQLIEEADADMYAEVIEHVTRCKLFQGGGIAALSSPRVFGAIYVRLPEDGVALGPYLIEHIIHETSHLALNALMAHDPPAGKPSGDSLGADSTRPAPSVPGASRHVRAPGRKSSPSPKASRARARPTRGDWTPWANRPRGPHSVRTLTQREPSSPTISWTTMED